MTCSLTLVNSSNWSSDEITVEHGPTKARKRTTLRRGEKMTVHPGGLGEEAHTLRFHHNDRSKDAESVFFAGEPQVTVTDPPRTTLHPNRVK